MSMHISRQARRPICKRAGKQVNKYICHKLVDGVSEKTIIKNMNFACNECKLTCCKMRRSLARLSRPTKQVTYWSQNNNKTVETKKNVAANQQQHGGYHNLKWIKIIYLELQFFCCSPNCCSCFYRCCLHPAIFLYFIYIGLYYLMFFVVGTAVFALTKYY